jgi:CHASE3 domain sensor protein
MNQDSIITWRCLKNGFHRTNHRGLTYDILVYSTEAWLTISCERDTFQPISQRIHSENGQTFLEAAKQKVDRLVMEMESNIKLVRAVKPNN